jgi:sulfotransferase
LEQIKKNNLQISENKDKKIFFLSALPRSGNTLFGSIMNQNPDIGATANSITLEIMKDIFLLKQTDVFQNYPDHKSLDNVLSSVYDSYYKDWNYKYIIDRGPVMTPGNLMLMKQHLGQPIKCIIIWRDVLDVLASFIKWFETEPTAFINRFGKTIEDKLWKLMNKEGAIAKELEGIKNALKSENKHMCHFLKYDELVNDTENQINKIYDFLEIPRFNHNFKTLNQFKVNGMSYDDKVVGNRMHTIRQEIKKETNPYRAMIPESITRAYGHIVL